MLPALLESFDDVGLLGHIELENEELGFGVLCDEGIEHRWLAKGCDDGVARGKGELSEETSKTGG